MRQKILLLENGADSVCLFCGLLCSVCPSDPSSVYSRGPDQPAGSKVFEDCLPGSASYSGEFFDQLYPSGYGERASVGNPHLQPSGASEYPPSDHHGHNSRTLRYDLDPAGGGSDHAAGVLWHVYVYPERT